MNNFYSIIVDISKGTFEKDKCSFETSDSQADVDTTRTEKVNRKGPTVDAFIAN